MRGHNDLIELLIRAKRFILLVFYWQLMCLSRVCILRRGPVLLGDFRFLNGAFGDCCCFTFSSEEFHPSDVNTGQTPASLSCCPQPVPTPALASWWFFGWWSLHKPAEKIPSALPSVHLMVSSAQRDKGRPKRASVWCRDKHCPVRPQPGPLRRQLAPPFLSRQVPVGAFSEPGQVTHDACFTYVSRCVVCWTVQTAVQLWFNSLDAKILA